MRKRIVRMGISWGIIVLCAAGLVFPLSAQDADGDAPASKLYRVLKDGKWGYIDASGEVVIPIRYDYGFPFRNGFTVVRKGDYATGKRAFFRNDGKRITPFRFDRAYHFENGFGIGEIDGKRGFVGPEGNPVGGFRWDRAGDFQDGYAEVRVGGYRDGLYGLLDTKGELVLDAAYDRISYLDEGLWAARNAEGLWAVFRPEEGKPTDYRYIDVEDFSGGLAVFAEKSEGGGGRRYSIVNTQLETVYTSEDEIRHVSEQIMSIKHNWNGRWVYRHVDTGELIGSADGYHRAGRFHNGRAVVGVGTDWRDREYGVLSADGTPVTALKYDYIYSFNENGLAKVRLDGQYGFIDRNGEQIVEPVWERVGSFASNRCPVMRDGRWGYVAGNGSVAIPLSFDDAWDFVDGIAVVRKGDKVTGERLYITPEGKKAFSQGFAWAYAFDGPLAHVAGGDFENGVFGYIDREGAIVWELQN